MPKTIETTVYTYSELSDSAKSNARNWFRDGGFDYDWYDSVYEDVKACGAMLGITVDKIMFSGFASQGDGACFEGSYRYASNASQDVGAYTGGMETLVNLANELETIQASANFTLTATVKHKGSYCHEFCTSIDVIDESDSLHYTEENSISNALRSFMRWIYRELESAYEAITSDSAVAESIEINEYTFDENGKRFG